MPGILLPLPIKAGLKIEPVQFMAVIASLVGLPHTAPNRDELLAHWNDHDYYRFRPDGVRIKNGKIILNGYYREQATDPGETWEAGLLVITRDQGKFLWSSAAVFPANAYNLLLDIE